MTRSHWTGLLLAGPLLAVGCNNPVGEARRLAEAGKSAEAAALLDEACHQKENERACLAAGVERFEAGSLDEAQLYADEAVRLDDSDPVARLLVGNIHFAREEWDEAYEEYERASRLDDEAAMPRVNMAAVLLEQDRIDAAAEQIAKALKLNDSEPLVHYNHGRILLAQGKIEKAEQAFHVANELDPSHFDTLLALADVARARERPSEELGYVLRCVALHPEESALHVRAGQLLLAQGQTQAAVTELRQATSQHPSPANHAALAHAYLTAGNSRAAVAHLRAALEKQPADPVLSTELALALLGAGELDAADRELKVVLDDHPELAEPHYVAGLLAATRREDARARKQFEAALARDPQHAGAHRELVRIAAADEDFDAVARHLRALSDDRIDADAELLLVKARMLARQGKSSQAVVALSAAVRKGAFSLDDALAFEELGALREDPDLAEVFANLESGN